MHDSERVASKVDGVLAVLQGIAAFVLPFMPQGLVQEWVIDGSHGIEPHAVCREIGVLARPCCTQDAVLIRVSFDCKRAKQGRLWYAWLFLLLACRHQE